MTRKTVSDDVDCEWVLEAGRELEKMQYRFEMHICFWSRERERTGGGRLVAG